MAIQRQTIIMAKHIPLVAKQRHVRYFGFIGKGHPGLKTENMEDIRARCKNLDCLLKFIST